jgi:hypothetical protein
MLEGLAVNLGAQDHHAIQTLQLVEIRPTAPSKSSAIRSPPNNTRPMSFRAAVICLRTQPDSTRDAEALRPNARGILRTAVEL